MLHTLYANLKTSWQTPLFRLEVVQAAEDLRGVDLRRVGIGVAVLLSLVVRHPDDFHAGGSRAHDTRNAILEDKTPFALLFGGATKQLSSVDEDIGVRLSSARLELVEVSSDSALQG